MMSEKRFNVSLGQYAYDGVFDYILIQNNVSEERVRWIEREVYNQIEKLRRDGIPADENNYVEIKVDGRDPLRLNKKKLLFKPIHVAAKEVTQPANPPAQGIYGVDLGAGSQLRIDCLKMAIGSLGRDEDPEKIIELAEKFYTFILNQTL